jgi:Na+-translocating ferredoxin:NAD+ oxidoreductase RnfD subunit
MACLGGLVAYRALRSDVALAFIVVYAGLLIGRSLYLGEPMTIPIRRLESGGLLLFTFFMISDPRTTPDHPVARVLYGALVAFVAWYIQFRLFRTNGVIWSLAMCSPLVPILDRVLPGTRFSWADAAVLPLVRRQPSPALALERIQVS